jgi:glycosyltransferase involved in cell wall biosynthesis
LKVVIIGPAFPLRGGIADFNEALAAGLMQEGMDVAMYSFYYQYPGILFPGKSQTSSGKQPDNLNIHSTLSSINPLSWIKTASKITNENPDIVIIRYWLPFMAPALGTVAKFLRRKNIRVIAITDNVIPHEKRIGDHAFTKYFVNNCDGFITMSRSVLKELEEFTSSKHKLFLPHPIYDIFGERISKSEARANLNLNVDDKIILFFGFIRAYKGLGILLDAMTDSHIRDRKIKLIVAGEFYEDESPYKNKIKEKNLSDTVLIHSNFIDKSKVKDYFCAADLVVQPYLNATQSGITQIAYHFHRPMIVTNVGGLAEIVQDGRVGYVTEKNSKALTDAIVKFYDGNMEVEFSRNVETDKERFSWNHFINGIIKLYEEIK